MPSNGPTSALAASSMSLTIALCAFALSQHERDPEDDDRRDDRAAQRRDRAGV
jgi:hypothetical protein